MCETKTTLTLYHRIGCHLCEQMAAALHLHQDELNYVVKMIDIDLNPDLKQRYDVDIPVVTYQDEIIFQYFFDEKLLRQQLVHG